MITLHDRFELQVPNYLSNFFEHRTLFHSIHCQLIWYYLVNIFCRWISPCETFSTVPLDKVDDVGNGIRSRTDWSCSALEGFTEKRRSRQTSSWVFCLLTTVPLMLDQKLASKSAFTNPLPPAQSSVSPSAQRKLKYCISLPRGKSTLSLTSSKARDWTWRIGLPILAAHCLRMPPSTTR